MPACETETVAHRTGNYIERAIEDPDGEMQQVRVQISELSAYLIQKLS